MDLLQIQYFLEAADCEHISKAADRLHIAQSALTKSIHRLEVELGVPLFLRKGRGVVLSEYGRFLRDRLLPLYQSLERIPEEVERMAKTENQTVHLNVLAASTMVTEAIINYLKEHELSFELTQNSEAGNCDIQVSTRLLYQIPEHYIGEQHVVTEKICLAVPSGHRLCETTNIRLQDASEEKFISLMGVRQFRWICDQFCRRAGFSPNIIFESDNPATVKNMIGAKMGVGFWPEFSWGRLEREDITLLELTDPVCQRDIVLSYHPRKADNRAVYDFFCYLVRQFEQKKITGE